MPHRKTSKRRVFKYLRLWERVVEVFPHVDFAYGLLYGGEAPKETSVVWKNRVEKGDPDHRNNEGFMVWRLPGVSMKFWRKVMADYKGRRECVKVEVVDGEEILVCELPCSSREFHEFTSPLWLKAQENYWDV